MLAPVSLPVLPHGLPPTDWLTKLPRVGCIKNYDNGGEVKNEFIDFRAKNHVINLISSPVVPEAAPSWLQSYYYYEQLCGHWNGIIRVFRNFSSFIASRSRSSSSSTGIYAQFSCAAVNERLHSRQSGRGRRRSDYTMLPLCLLILSTASHSTFKSTSDEETEKEGE